MYGPRYRDGDRLAQSVDNGVNPVMILLREESAEERIENDRGDRAHHVAD